MDLYELGVLNGVQIAARFGVHRDVIYRHLKAVGAVKGLRAPESIREIEAEIIARQTARLLTRRETDDRRLDQFIARGAAVEQFMKALLRADRDGKLVEFGRRLPAA